MLLLLLLLEQAQVTSYRTEIVWHNNSPTVKAGVIPLRAALPLLSIWARTRTAHTATAAARAAVAGEEHRRQERWMTETTTTATRLLEATTTWQKEMHWQKKL
jgi:hypothetical protein